MAHVLLVNARAGSTAREAIEAAEGVFGAHGGCERVETETAADLDEVVATLGDRQLVIAGGDGSVHLAVDRLREAGMLGEVTVGWVPLGTGNDLARTLDIPLDPAAAAEVVVTGRPRRLDLVVAEDGAVCVNAVHAGVGVDAAARAEGLKERVGEFAYPLGAVAAGVAAEGWDLVVELDGRVLRPDSPANVLLVAIMNGRAFGGGTEMSPEAMPDDGSLDVVVCSPVGPGQRAAFGVALRAGRHLERDDVAFGRGQSVRISGDPVGYNIDGELDEDETTDRSFAIEPASWSIITPR